MPSFTKLTAAPALLAAFSLTATPVQAADIAPVAPHAAASAAPAWMPGDDIAEKYRHHRYRRHRGVDAGDVLSGILILGGIAAVASAAKGPRDRRYPTDARYPDSRYPDSRYPDPRRGDARYDDGRGIDGAVSQCVSTIERDARVDTVDSVNRNASGWIVTGALFDGQRFTCAIGADGRIEAIDYGARGTAYSTDGPEAYGSPAGSADEDRQYDDDYYAAVRARTDTGAQAVAPAYPGGPLPGEDTGAVDADIEFGTGYRGAGA